MSDEDSIATRYSAARGALKRTEQEIILTRIRAAEQEIEWLWWSVSIFAVLAIAFLVFHQTK